MNIVSRICQHLPDPSHLHQGAKAHLFRGNRKQKEDIFPHTVGRPAAALGENGAPPTHGNIDPALALQFREGGPQGVAAHLKLGAERPLAGQMGGPVAGPDPLAQRPRGLRDEADALGKWRGDCWHPVLKENHQSPLGGPGARAKSHGMNRPDWNPNPLAILLSMIVIGSTSAQTPPSETPVPHPRVNLAPHYELVEGWPQKPPEVKWGAVPAMDFDREGNLWIYTRANPVVQVYAPDGRYLRGWTEENKATVPHGLRFDADGNVWLADVGLHVVRKFSPEGKLLLTLGTLGVAGKDEQHFNMPTSVAFAADGDIFVSDGYGNNRVVRFDREGRFLKAWGVLGTKPGEFSLPHAIACDSKGRLYVADRNNVRVQVFDREGALLDVWANLVVPWNFWITPADDIWVCGSSPMIWDDQFPDEPLGCPPKDQLIARFDPTGKLRELWTLPKGEDGRERLGQVNWLHSIAVDAKGDVYLGDIIGKRVQKFRRR